MLNQKLNHIPITTKKMDQITSKVENPDPVEMRQRHGQEEKGESEEKLSARTRASS